MAPLAVDPEALSAAGSAVVAAGDGVAANLTVLTAGFGANTGHDVAGTVFGLAYQDAAESLLKAATAAINACRCSGALIQTGASNYSKAEVASTLGGGAGVLQAPAEPVKIAAPGPPGTLGPGQPPPLLWAVVESFVDSVWPDGDVAGLHAAAARWRSFSAAVSGMQGALNASESLVSAQQIPEGGQIDQVLSQIGTSTASVGEQCGKLATTLDDFANEVEHAQNAIRDLLHRLGSLADLAHDVVLIFDGDALDEIKKVAHDINDVLHNLGREARAFEQGIKLVMQVGDGLVVGLEKYMRRQFTHFLGDAVGNQVATTFDFFANANEGFVKGAIGMVQGMVDLDPRWFLVDPKGAAATWMGMAKGGLVNALLNPQEAGEANIQMFKSLLHLEDWRRDRPGLGFGENVFDVGMLFLPGAGEAGGAAEGAGAAGCGAEAAKAAGTAERAGGRAAGGLADLAGARGALGDITRTSSGLTKDLEGLTGNLPKVDPPPGGRPVGLPPPKPFEAPVEPAPRTPESTVPVMPETESPTGPTGSTPGERPGAPVGPHEPGPAPAGGPHDPAPASVPAATPREPVSVLAATRERLPSPIPQLAEDSPARVPVSPSGTPVEPAPAATHSSHPAPAFTSAAPQASAPHFTPPSVRPPELPAPGSGGWHGPGDGGPPGGRPHGRPPHGGEPHGPGDGGPLGGRRYGQAPRDGGPHRPGDGGPRDDRPHGPPSDGTPHGPSDDGGLHEDDASSGGLSAEKRDEIIATPKGIRPDPSEYLSPEYIESHLEKFTDGATRFMPESNLEKYGIAQRDGTSFVIPKNEADAMIEATVGDPRAIENELGLPEGFLDSNNIVRIDIADPEAFHLRMPSGNEAGANDQWIPGGQLPNGASEAVVDGGDIPPDDYTVTDVFK